MAKHQVYLYVTAKEIYMMKITWLNLIGLYFALRHEIKEEQPNEEICPIATHPYEILGTQLYESIDELVKRWNNLKIQRIPSFDEILEANRDVLERIKEKGD